jgi:hypothetical protein
MRSDDWVASHQFPIKTEGASDRAGITAADAKNNPIEIAEIVETKLQLLFNIASSLKKQFTYHWYENHTMPLQRPIPVQECSEDFGTAVAVGA